MNGTIQRKHLIASLLIFLISISTKANTTSDSIQYKRLQKYTITRVDWQMFLKTQQSEENTMEGFSEINLNLNYAHKTKYDGMYVFASASYSSFACEYLTENSEEDIKFHHARLDIGLSKQLSRDWKIIGIITPMLSSSLESDISKNDFFFETSLLAKKRVNPYLEVGFGAYYANGLMQNSKQVIIPIATLAYKKDRVSITGVFPDELAALYKISKLSIGLRTKYKDLYYYNSSKKIDKNETWQIHNKRLQVGPTCVFETPDNMCLELNAGVIIHNSVVGYNKSMSESFDYMLPERFVFSLSLYLRQ